MARIRTFIAVDVANSVKSRLEDLRETLAAEGTDVRWSPTENYHLTLLFLGEILRNEIVDVCRVVTARAKKHKPFSLTFAGLGGFPNNRRPKVLWAGVTDGLEPLRALHADLEEGLLQLGTYRREDRGYTPHLTLGRLTKSEKAEDWSPILAKHGGWDGGNSHVGEVLVMASDYSREDSQYTVLGRGALKG